MFTGLMKKQSISRIFLIVFVVMLLLSRLLLSVAGDYTPWYIITGFCLAPVLLLGKQKIRIYATFGLILIFILIMNDYVGGKERTRNRLEYKLKLRDMHYSKQIDELKKKLEQDEKFNKNT